MHSIENGGIDVSHFMEEPLGLILQEKGESYGSIGVEKGSLIKSIKEKVSAVALDYEVAVQEMNMDDLELRAFVLPGKE